MKDSFSYAEVADFQNKAYFTGVVSERSRIIALLEAELPGLRNGIEIHDEIVSETIQDLIALIKGETE